MITKIHLQNFKSWKTLDMPLGRMTGIFGSNSSGKSSIIHSLLLLKQTVESSDRSLPLKLGSEHDYVELGSFNDVIHSHQQESTMTFALNWTLLNDFTIIDTQSDKNTLLATRDIAFQTSIASDANNKMHVEQITYTLKNEQIGIKKNKEYYKIFCKNDRAFHFVRTPGRNWDLPHPFKFHGFPDQAVTYFQNSEFLPDLQQETEKLFTAIHYLGPLRQHPKRRYVWTGGEPENVGQRGERTIDAILAARERGAYISPGLRKKKRTLEEQIAFWLKKLNLIHSFQLAAIGDESSLYTVKVKRTAKSPEVLITDVGFGVSQILPVIALCYYVAEGSTILLEQPEIHLHPSIQMGLADMFIDAMKTRNVQIIIESHSEHLLTRLQRRLAEERISTDDTKLYFCDTGPSSSQLQPLHINDHGHITNWPKNFFGDRFGETAALQMAGLERTIKDTQ